MLECNYRKDIAFRMENEDVDTLTKVGIMHLMMGESQTAFTTLLDALAFAQSSPKLLLALGGILQVSTGMQIGSWLQSQSLIIIRSR